MPPSSASAISAGRLADPGKDDLFGRDAGGTGAAIFPARDDVGAEPKCREGCEHRAVRIGLDGVSDQRIGKAAKRPLEPLRLPPHTRAGVDVDGRSTEAAIVGSGTSSQWMTPFRRLKASELIMVIANGGTRRNGRVPPAGQNFSSVWNVKERPRGSATRGSQELPPPVKLS
jgi:hypothetical protein